MNKTVRKILEDRQAKLKFELQYYEDSFLKTQKDYQEISKFLNEWITKK